VTGVPHRAQGRVSFFTAHGPPSLFFRHSGKSSRKAYILPVADGKTIVPGIRVGFAAGDPALIARLAQLKQITDLHSSSLGQRIALRFCLEGHLEPQIAHLRAAYRERRDTMLRALSAHITGLATWTHPQGGMFLLLTLPEGIDTAALLPRAMEAGVAFVPGGTFFPHGGGDHTLRLNFVSALPERIEEGIRILAWVLRASLAEHAVLPNNR
jgi:2-aminoadipate transaminase